MQVSFSPFSGETETYQQIPANASGGMLLMCMRVRGTGRPREEYLLLGPEGVPPSLERMYFCFPGLKNVLGFTAALRTSFPIEYPKQTQCKPEGVVGGLGSRGRMKVQLLL